MTKPVKPTPPARVVVTEWSITQMYGQLKERIRKLYKANEVTADG